jgi:anti-sigma regulatory factor (Ser/Thr protein kinase)
MATTEAGRLGLADSDAAKLSLAVTEIGTNLVKHAGGGEIILRRIESALWRGIEVLALDRGPGMRDVDECMRDGFSTGGSPGTGLGAIARVADQFDIYTYPGRGTALMARFQAGMAQPADVRTDRIEIEAIVIPKSGETIAGDAWASGPVRHGAQILVADGLGHGPLAGAAAGAAVKAFHECLGESPTALIETMHGALRSTRGAAAAVAEIDTERGAVRFAGVGNIASAVMIDDRVHRMVSHNGTLGHELRKVHEFTYPWMRGALLIMHSDGLTTHWDLAAYPGLRLRHPSVIAAVLYRDHSRGRDDVTVLVARQEEEE